MIWLIGSSGMLGRAVAKVLDEKGFYWVGSHKNVDITNSKAIENFITSTESERYTESHRKFSDSTERKIKWIINCTGFTDVDLAETEEGASLAKAVNKEGVLNIARVARSRGAKLVHISSDYIFDGKATVPYKETDAKCPINEYGKTKAQAEDAITSSMSQYYIIRTGCLFGFGKDNFVTKVLSALQTKAELTFASDRMVCPTSCEDLASVIALIIERGEKAKSIFGRNSALSFGVYNFTNEGSVAVSNFAKKVLEEGVKLGMVQSKCKILEAKAGAIAMQNANTAQRPLYTVLDCGKITKEMRLKVPTWEMAFHSYMTKLANEQADK